MGATRSNSDAAQGAPTKLWRPPSEEAQRRDAPNSPPSRRVAAKRGVCGVTPLGKGDARAGAARLASIPVWLQRIPRGKSDRLLGLAGFTLVELLVVLAIMAFATLAVAPSLQRLAAPRPPRPAVEQLLTAIGRSRDEAIQKRHTFRGSLDPGNRLWQDGEGRVLFQLPDETLIAPDNGASTEPLSCVFRPDGSGCKLSLKVVQDGQEWQVKVDPVTGRIRLLRLVSQ